MPPRWTVEPTDKQFAQGSDGKVDCKADGFPKPKIGWKKAPGMENQHCHLYHEWYYPPIIVIIIIINNIFINFTISGNKPEDYRDLDTNVQSNVKVIDGALTMKNIQKENEGYYLCKSTNGIGRGLSAVIYISVQGEQF